jgi:hypothetical protein
MVYGRIERRQHFPRALLTVVIAFAVIASSGLLAASISIHFDEQSPESAFAVRDIKGSLAQRKYDVLLKDFKSLAESLDELSVVLAIQNDTPVMSELKSAGAEISATLREEGFSIRKTANGGKTILWVIGYDAAGAMYGGLELAEVIRTGGPISVEDLDQNPYMGMRGTKFNCPLDVRTPSYSDPSDSAQQNIAEMWSFDFRKEDIDNLARHRFNCISLWSLHPFPSLVKVPEYEEIALADVQRSTVEWKENYSLNGLGFDAPEILNSVEVLKRMTIEEKIAFWRKVMRYGRERNVDFFIVTWNIFVNGTGGKYGITAEIDNKTTQDYFRRSVKELFLTYPDLKGIGLTTGENMPEASTDEKEAWAFNTYASGVLDATRELPERKITFIHRQHQTGALEIADRFQPLVEHPDIEFIFSFKYAKAHALSSTRQTYHSGFVKDIQGRGRLKTIWTLRNDDVYHFRWGAPDFVREFIQNIPYEVSRGFYYGALVNLRL